MKILQFELLKLRKKKLFLWMFLIILLCTSGLFLHNYAQKSSMKERAIELIEPYEEEMNSITKELNQQKQIEQTEVVNKQLDYVIEMNKALFNWRVAIYDEAWDLIPRYENDFLLALSEFTRLGGEFKSLQGIEREKAILKNEWMIKYNLPYVDELFPLDPVLFFVKNAEFLFGVGGFILLLLLFGHIFTVEKEQHTWRLLNTLPFTKRKLMVSKFIVLIISMIVFIISVFVFGMIIPLVFGVQSFHFQYPQIFQSGETIIIIPTMYFILRMILFFISGCFVMNALLLFLSRWIQNTFLTRIGMGMIILLSFLLTELIPTSKKFWNPLIYLHLDSLFTDPPHQTDWLYLVGAIILGSGLVVLTILLPNPKLGKFSSSDYQKPFFKGETKIHGSILSKMVIFEYVKVWRKGYFKQSIILLSLFFGICYLLLSMETTEKEKYYFKELDTELTTFKEIIIPSYNDLLISLEEEEKNGNDVSEELTNRKKELNIINTIVDKGESAVFAYQKGDWIPLLEYQLFYNHFVNEESVQNLHVEYKKSLSQFSVDVGIAEKMWLIEHQIKPVISGNFVPTIFSQWEGEKMTIDWLKSNVKVNNSGLFSLYHFFEYQIYLVLIIMMVSIFGSGFASEHGKMQTFNFLKTQPIAEKYIFLGKVLNSVILSLLASIGLLAFILVIGTFFKEFGDWQYPILYYDHPSIVQELNYSGTKSAFGLGFHFMYLGDYLIKTTILFAFILTFTIVLAIFLSMFIKNVFTNYAITIVIVVLGYIGSINILKEFAHLSPFTYFQIFKITNGELSIVLDQPSINFLTGSIVLITSISILTILGYWIKHKSVGSFKNTSELETETEMEKVRHITDEK